MCFAMLLVCTCCDFCLTLFLCHSFLFISVTFCSSENTGCLGLRMGKPGLSHVHPQHPNPASAGVPLTTPLLWRPGFGKNKGHALLEGVISCTLPCGHRRPPSQHWAKRSYELELRFPLLALALDQASSSSLMCEGHLLTASSLLTEAGASHLLGLPLSVAD